MKSNCRFLIGASLAAAAVFSSAYYYRDVFVYRTQLGDPHLERGVVFYDPLRATPGLHIVDQSLLQKNSYCPEIQTPGVSFLGELGAFLADGSFVTFAGKLVFFTPDGLPLWMRDLHIHHDLFVDAEHKEILALHEQRRKTHWGSKNLTIRFNLISIYDFKGNQTFFWDEMQHIPELENALGHKLSPVTDDAGGFELTHMNSAQIIEDNALYPEFPAFKPGNILLNEFNKGLAFILARDSKKIVWHHIFGDAKGHQLRLLSDGSMVLLVNRQMNEGKRVSAIGFFDPIKKTWKKQVMMRPPESFYTPYWGSVQILPKGRFLVTDSLAGRAFEIDSSGRIYWEWVNPNNTRKRTEPVYRVRLVPENRVRKMIKAWGLGF